MTEGSTNKTPESMIVKGKKNDGQEKLNEEKKVTRVTALYIIVHKTGFGKQVWTLVIEFAQNSINSKSKLPKFFVEMFHRYKTQSLITCFVSKGLKVMLDLIPLFCKIKCQLSDLILKM